MTHRGISPLSSFLVETARWNGSGMFEQLDDVACTVCGCVCDDLRMTVVEGQMTESKSSK